MTFAHDTMPTPADLRPLLHALEAAMTLQAPWVNDLADGLGVEDIATVHKVILRLRARLEMADEASTDG